MALLIRNLSQVATPIGRAGLRGEAMRKIAIYENAVIVVRDGKIAYVGPDRRTDFPITEEFDARRATAVPGFVDSHTHLPWAGFRESEFNRRIQGETYEQIAASGGGIASTVRATRAATEQQLIDNVLQRAHAMSRHGTTTAEAKSGYGLNVADEIKQLRAIRAANENSPVRLVPTCLAAHDFPPERRDASYVDQIVDEILPVVAREKFAVFCDAFVEAGASSRQH